MRFYRRKTWRILALQKFLSTAYRIIVFRPAPRIENKEVDSLSRWWNARLARLFTDGFVENLRTVEEISAAEILRPSPQRCVGHLRAA
jgi:hypothetical protein